MNPLVFFLHLETNIKLYHWMTRSYARHVATDSLHEKILEQTDKFVEVYIGKYKRPSLQKKDLNITLGNHSDKDILVFLDFAINYLTKDLFKYITDKDTDLVNIRDDILSAINQAKYLYTLN